MTFDYPGYQLKFIQKERCNDDSAHLFTEIFKLHSPVTGLNYIINVDYHKEDVFAVKFYVQQHSKSDYKYQIITNKKDLGNILNTCLMVIPELLLKYPVASFAFIASPSFDLKTKTVEPIVRNQRFRTYTYLVSQKIGTSTFEHIIYEGISGYLLLNKKEGGFEEREYAIKKMFTDTCPRLLEMS